MKWIHRDDVRPADRTCVVISTAGFNVHTGYYDEKLRSVDTEAGDCWPWSIVIGWMYKEDFPFPKEEDFE